MDTSTTIVGTSEINDSAVTTAKINDSAVTTAKLNNGAVTNDKVSSGVARDKISAPLMAGGSGSGTFTASASSGVYQTVCTYAGSASWKANRCIRIDVQMGWGAGISECSISGTGQVLGRLTFNGVVVAEAVLATGGGGGLVHFTVPISAHTYAATDGAKVVNFDVARSYSSAPTVTLTNVAIRTIQF